MSKISRTINNIIVNKIKDISIGSKLLQIRGWDLVKKFNDLITVDEKNRRIVSRIGWALSVLVIFSQIGGVIVSVIGNLFFRKFAQTSIFTFLSGVMPIYLIGFPVFAIIIKKIPKRINIEKRKLNIVEIMKLIIISFGALYILNILTNLINLGISILKGSQVINPLASFLDNANIYQITFFVAILAPIMEEIIFRGILISRLRQFGDEVCIFVSAFSFAMFHGNLSQFFYAFALGCIFAYTVLKCGTIKYAILLHMIINFVGSVVSLKIALSGNIILAGVLFFFVIAMILGTIILIILEKDKIVLKQGNIYLTKKEKFKLIFNNSGMMTYVALSLILIIITTFLSK